VDEVEKVEKVGEVEEVEKLGKRTEMSMNEARAAGVGGACRSTQAGANGAEEMGPTEGVGGEGEGVKEGAREGAGGGGDAKRPSNPGSNAKPVEGRRIGSTEEDDWTQYASQSEAGRRCGVNVGAISQCTSGRHATAGGYVFRYSNPSMGDGDGDGDGDEEGERVGEREGDGGGLVGGVTEAGANEGTKEANEGTKEATEATKEANEGTKEANEGMNEGAKEEANEEGNEEANEGTKGGFEFESSLDTPPSPSFTSPPPSPPPTPVGLFGRWS
jgi:hypothetical protein